MAVNSVLLIDDDPLIQRSFELALTGEAIELRPALTAGEGIRDFTVNRPHVVICDVRLPDRSGLDLLADLQAVDAKVPVILMTGHGTAETAIEAMRKGAFDYLLKPFDPDQLLEVMTRALEVGRLMRVPARVAATQDEESGDGELFIGQSAAMQDVFKTIGRVAPTNAAVLVLGESGTGKELVPGRFTITASGWTNHFWRSTVQPFRKRCWKVNSSDMRKVHSPERIGSGSASSSSATAALCSSMKLGT